MNVPAPSGSSIKETKEQETSRQCQPLVGCKCGGRLSVVGHRPVGLNGATSTVLNQEGGAIV